MNKKNIGTKNIIYAKQKIKEDFELSEKEYQNTYSLISRKVRNFESVYGEKITLDRKGLINYYYKRKEGNLYYENKLFESILNLSTTKNSKKNDIKMIEYYSSFQGFETFSQGFEQLEKAKAYAKDFINGNFDNWENLKTLQFNKRLNSKGVVLRQTNPNAKKVLNYMNQIIKEFNKQMREKKKNKDSKGIAEIYLNFVREFMEEVNTAYESGYFDSDGD